MHCKDAGYCYACSDVAWCVYLSLVGHDHQPCKNGRTDRDAVWAGRHVWVHEAMYHKWVTEGAKPGEYVKSIREGYDAASCYRYCSKVAHIHIVLIAIPANLR